MKMRCPSSEQAGRGAFRSFETLARSAQTPPKEIQGKWFWVCNAVLEMHYDTMTRKALAREARGRRLRKLPLTSILARFKGRKGVRQNRRSSAQVLRSRLQESDKSFEERFPRSGCLEDLSAATLRTLAGQLSVRQGDRTIATLADNIRKFAEQRLAGYEQRMGHNCWNIARQGDKGYLDSWIRTRLREDFARERMAAFPHKGIASKD